MLFILNIFKKCGRKWENVGKMCISLSHKPTRALDA